MQGALRGIRAAVVGMIFVAGLVILQTAWNDVDLVGAAQLQYTGVLLALFAASLVALIRYKVSVLAVIPMAGLVGIFAI